MSPTDAREGAAAIHQAFADYHAEFKAITRRARARFEDRNWHAAQRDAVERLDLRAGIIQRVVAGIHAILREEAQDKSVWALMKAEYSRLIAGRDDFELAETFFNSVTRRIFATVGVATNIEYVDSDFEPRPAETHRPVYQTYISKTTTRDLVRAVLADRKFNVPYLDLDRDAALVADEIDRCLGAAGGDPAIGAVEMAQPIFYRNKGAYLVGRIRQGERLTPLVLPLLNDERGVTVDAVLLTESEASIVFSFTRSYFHVEVERPYELIHFLKSIMPLKRVAELYISIGYNKHGKTELYRDLLRHLARSGDRFERARGDRGMVMVVFTLPSYDIVFKVIRGSFAYPKATTRQEVMAKYQLVFNHDRAGRLVDAQEFEHLKFDRGRFADELLAELLEVAPNSVTVEGDGVVIRHLYTERRLTPLNLYIRENGETAAADAVIDYGQAIKDLAATNIFPGDLLLKNFGVTRHGRVVFYDYDELCPLTDCNFRDLPRAATADEEFGAEPWFYVGEDDIFPEELMPFLGLQGRMREVFVDAHADLLGVAFWTRMQERHRAGEVMDIFPYRQSKRLHGK